MGKMFSGQSVGVVLDVVVPQFGHYTRLLAHNANMLMIHMDNDCCVSMLAFVN